MAKTDYTSVDEYIAAQPAHARSALRKVRRIIRKAVPSAAESISYQLPTFRVPDGPLLSLGGWKEHYSLYPTGDDMVAAFKGALTPYRTSKGTLRFPLSEPVPAALIARIARFRARQVRLKAKAKRAR